MSDLQAVAQLVDSDFIMNVVQATMATGCVLCAVFAIVVGVLEQSGAN